MKTFDELVEQAKQRGFTVGTFSTNGRNFYNDAVVFVGVGNPTNRNSYLVLETWDASYSLGKTPTEKNKIGRAIIAVENYINTHTTPNIEELTAREMLRRRNKNNTNRRKLNAARQSHNTLFCNEQNKIANSEQITPTEAIERGLISEKYRETFGIDDIERAELMNEKSLRLWNNQIMIFEGQLGEPAQWRLLQPRPHMAAGCLRKQPIQFGRTE